jgi:uncharacterized protein
VDIGVHQDGLVHVSELANRFIKDPHEVVKAGDVVKVRVKEVDVARKRISLTMRAGAIDQPSARSPGSSAVHTMPRGGGLPPARSPTAAPQQTSAPAESALAAALRRAQERK